MHFPDCRELPTALQRLEERHQVLPLLIGEDKTQAPLVVSNHVLESRRVTFS